eukprot:gene12019-biopygen13983
MFRFGLVQKHNRWPHAGTGNANCDAPPQTVSPGCGQKWPQTSQTCIREYRNSPHIAPQRIVRTVNRFPKGSVASSGKSSVGMGQAVEFYKIRSSFFLFRAVVGWVLEWVQAQCNVGAVSVACGYTQVQHRCNSGATQVQLGCDAGGKRVQCRWKACAMQVESVCYVDETWEKHGFNVGGKRVLRW